MTGWSWSEVSEMTLPRLTFLNKGWAKHPPIAAMVASYLGYNKSKPAQKENHADLAGIFGSGPSIIDKGLKNGG